MYDPLAVQVMYSDAYHCEVSQNLFLWKRYIFISPDVDKILKVSTWSQLGDHTSLISQVELIDVSDSKGMIQVLHNVCLFVV